MRLGFDISLELYLQQPSSELTYTGIYITMKLALELHISFSDLSHTGSQYNRIISISPSTLITIRHKMSTHSAFISVIYYDIRSSCLARNFQVQKSLISAQKVQSPLKLYC